MTHVHAQLAAAQAIASSPFKSNHSDDIAQPVAVGRMDFPAGCVDDRGGSVHWRARDGFNRWRQHCSFVQKSWRVVLHAINCLESITGVYVGTEKH